MVNVIKVDVEGESDLENFCKFLSVVKILVDVIVKMVEVVKGVVVYFDSEE